GSNFSLFGDEAFDNLLYRVFQVREVEIKNDIGDSPAYIRLDHVKKLLYLWGKTQDNEMVIKKYGSDLRVVKEIFHIIIELRELFSFSLELSINGHQLLIERLHFLFSGQRLLIGALKFLVRAL